MSPAVAQLVAGLTPPIIDRLASNYRYDLRPWEMQLLAAQATSGEALYEMHVYSVQLLATGGIDPAAGSNRKLFGGSRHGTSFLHKPSATQSVPVTLLSDLERFRAKNDKFPCYA